MTNNKNNTKTHVHTKVGRLASRIKLWKYKRLKGRIKNEETFGESGRVFHKGCVKKEAPVYHVVECLSN